MNKSKNTSCVYTGKVGRKLRPSFRGCFSSKRVIKHSVRCFGGPMHGHRLFLSSCGGLSTLTFRLGASSGRYIRGEWHPL